MNKSMIGGRNVALGAISSGDIPIWDAVKKTWVTDNFRNRQLGYGCRVFGGADQTIPSAVVTSLVFQSESYDTNGYHAGSSTDVIIPAGLGGYYSMYARAAFDAAVSYNDIYIYLNGVVLSFMQYGPSSGAAGAYGYMQVSDQYHLAAGDVLTLRVKQISGGNLNIKATGATYPVLEINWLGN